MKKLNTLLFLIFCCCSISYAQSSLRGKITDTDTGEELIGATVQVFKNGISLRGISTDFDGNYLFQLDPGVYDLQVSYVGYNINRLEGINIYPNRINKRDIQLSTAEALPEIIVIGDKDPIIDPDAKGGEVFTEEEIEKLGNISVTEIIGLTPAIVTQDGTNNISVKGSRFNANNFIVDDIRVSGNFLIPTSEIEIMDVMTGAIPAKYGDALGGVIAITTKGPSKTFAAGFEIETSQFLDGYNYNLYNFNLSSPLLKKRKGKQKGEPIIGLRLSGRFLSRLDDNPAATDVFKIKADKLAEIQANPLTRLGVSNLPTAEFLTNEDVDIFNHRQNEKSERIDLTAKIDARFNKNIDLSFTGAYADFQDQFTPQASWRLMNSHNNPISKNNSYRGSFRFRHKLGNKVLGTEELVEKATKGSTFSNAQYSIIFGYEKTQFEVNDPRHGDQAFNYGHIGRFDYEWVPIIDFAGNEFAHRDHRREFRNYQPGATNPVLANYNNNADWTDVNDLSAFNGFFAGPVNAAWNSHTNVGTVYNRIGKRNNDLINLGISSSFNFIPKGSSDKGIHTFQFGLSYEQRINRGYELAPRDLWTIARQQSNRQILGVDTTSVIGSEIFAGQEVDIFNTYIVDFPELLFYKKLRSVAFPDMPLEDALHLYANVDNLSPDQLSLDMFSPQEITDQGLVNYWGFDYQGNLADDDITFNDFFSERDANGIRSFPVAAQKPIYMAAYIQDKFSFKDIIFNVGLRIDRYDANTKVMKDPYSLYDIMQANDFYDQTGIERPTAVQDHYKVYVSGEGSNDVVAFRDGDQWFFDNGNPANDGNIIFGGQVVNPKYSNPDANIKSPDFDPSNSFEDYQPQLKWMPRLSFSFPISDVANFFAHYDVLVQRPNSNTLATALDYFYFNERTPENNPNLKPLRTVDYEVGFQQKLSANSALKITAYYREMRDMIQTRTYLYVPAPINQYSSFGNLDFGTVKGFTFQYDLRKTGNVTFNAAYTLQYADGTGSEADSQRGLTSRGNIRNLFPLDYDVRHRIITNIDLRYLGGKKYNGPDLFGKPIFANAGINIQTTTSSGSPYTANITPTQLGGTGTRGAINGARLPWQFTLNLRANKRFALSKSEKFPVDVNVYVRIQNVLDRRNIDNVYSVTGSPTDDGYLDSSFGRDSRNQVAASGKDETAFLHAYQWRLLNPDNFTLPRRIYLGAAFEF